MFSSYHGLSWISTLPEDGKKPRNRERKAAIGVRFFDNFREVRQCGRIITQRMKRLRRIDNPHLRRQCKVEWPERPALRNPD
jgi:hypothetical protein